MSRVQVQPGASTFGVLFHPQHWHMFLFKTSLKIFSLRRQATFICSLVQRLSGFSLAYRRIKGRE
jgi:hypothetical protein